MSGYVLTWKGCQESQRLLANIFGLKTAQAVVA